MLLGKECSTLLVMTESCITLFHCFLFILLLTGPDIPIYQTFLPTTPLCKFLGGLKITMQAPKFHDITDRIWHTLCPGHDLLAK